MSDTGSEDPAAPEAEQDSAKRFVGRAVFHGALFAAFWLTWKAIRGSDYDIETAALMSVGWGLGTAWFLPRAEAKRRARSR